MQWVEMDPQMETLASTCLLQPDWMWAGQLERSKDTAAQSVAVAGLAALHPTTHTAVSALEHCLANDQVYPRHALSQLVWADLEHLPTVRTRFYCPQAFLGSFFSLYDGCFCGVIDREEHYVVVTHTMPTSRRVHMHVSLFASKGAAFIHLFVILFIYTTMHTLHTMHIHPVSHCSVVDSVSH